MEKKDKRLSTAEFVGLWNSVEPGEESWSKLLDTFVAGLRDRRQKSWDGLPEDQIRAIVDKYLVSKRADFLRNEEVFLRIHHRPARSQHRDLEGNLINIGNMYEALKNLPTSEINAILRAKTRNIMPLTARKAQYRYLKAHLQARGIKFD